MIWVFALLLAAPASAREGGPIRTGEHPGFTRVVMEIDPATEWSLETQGGTAVILFPGRAIEFGTDGVWERIPRARVTSIAATRGPEGARVTLGLGCDCRVTASFVGARRLAIDVIDRGAVAPLPPARETEAAREAREGEIVASAEAALAAQIVHAADQGVVQLTGAAPAPAVAAVPARPEAAAAPVEAALSDQITAISVYDRDDAALEALREAVPPPEACLPDEAFDLGAWSDGTGYGAEAARLMRRIVGEFDRTDPEALRALVRLRIRYGFGLEAEAELAAFGDAGLADRALLADLARAVEGRAVAADGALALAEDCPGAHALWLAVAGVAPAWRGPIQFAVVQEAFAALPPDLRALVGPGLAGRLLDQGREAGAAAIVAISRRPGLPETPEQVFVRARLLAAEGAPEAALALLRGLAESGAPVAPQALAALARIAFDQGVALPDRMITDVAAAATAAWGGPEEVALRGLLVASLGARGELGAAVAEAGRSASPEARAVLAARAVLTARAVEAVAAADPAAVGGAVYAEAALAVGPMIGPGVAHDPERLAIAGRLIALGLPNAAIDLLAPATLRGDPGALRLVAAAALALGRPVEAVAAVTRLNDPEAARLHAAALAAQGAPDRAVEALAAAGVADEGYAWIAGDWARAREAAVADPARAAMAAYMAGRGGPRSGSAPETPEAAFAQRPLAPARPSLGAARDLIATGRQLDDFLGAVLAEGSEP